MRRVIVLLLISCSFVAACGSRPNSTPATAESTRVTGVASDGIVGAGEPNATARTAPTPYASAMPLPTPRTPLMEVYVVQPGDTLGGISLAYDVPLEDLVTLNDLESESAIIHIGQALQIPVNISRRTRVNLTAGQRGGLQPGVRRL